MMRQTKTRVMPIVFTVLVLAAGLYLAPAGVAVLRAMNQPRTLPSVNTGDQLVTFLVTFTGKPHDKDVYIKLDAPAPPVPFQTRDSPWVEERMLPPGTPVGLRALQPMKGVMTCKIRVGLRKIAEQTIEQAGGVICAGKV